MIAGKILRDFVFSETNQYAYLYDPFRKIKGKELLVKGRDYLGIMIHGAFRNLFVKEKKD